MGTFTGERKLSHGQEYLSSIQHNLTPKIISKYVDFTKSKSLKLIMVSKKLGKVTSMLPLFRVLLMDEWEKQSPLHITTLVYRTPRLRDVFRPSPELCSVNLPSYYNYNARNMTFFMHDLSYNRSNQRAKLVRPTSISRSIRD